MVHFIYMETHFIPLGFCFFLYKIALVYKYTSNVKNQLLDYTLILELW